VRIGRIGSNTLPLSPNPSQAFLLFMKSTTAQTQQTRSAQVLTVPKGRMTHEQVGRILTLADELGEFDNGLEFIGKVRSEEEAERYINDLAGRIDQL
jgi:hypothetical protein